MHLLKLTLPISDPILVFSTILAVILIAPLLFTRLRLPGIVGIILFGVILGPSVTGILEVQGAITLLGQVGLLYIMFLAGLEINLNEFFKHKERSLIFGILTFSIPQFFGTVIFLFLGYDWLASLLIASMFASHTLVSFPIITRMGIGQNRAVITTVGGTIFTDTLALLLLAVIAKAYQGDLNLSFWFKLAIMLSLYVIGISTLLPRMSRWFFLNVKDQMLEFLYVLVIAFSFSYIARLIGIEPIVGAFFVGLVLNRLIPSTGPLMNRIRFVGNSIFIPFFLLYIGMLVDITVFFSNWKVWIVMLTMLATNCLTKLISSKITQRIFKFTKAEGWVIFGLSTTEAAATLAATLVGLRLGIIGNEVLNGVILMILVTNILGAAVVQHNSKIIAKAEETDIPDSDYEQQRLLVPIANPENASHLMQVAIILKDNSSEPIFPMTIVKQDEDSEENIRKNEKMLEMICDYAHGADIPVSALMRIDINIANGISRAVKETRISSVIIGWNGQRSTQERIFGSILDQLLDQTFQEVFVCKLSKPVTGFKKIILFIPPYCYKEFGFMKQMKCIIKLASQFGAEIIIVAEYSAIDELNNLINKIKTDLNYSYITPERWDLNNINLNNVLNSNDLIVLISARKGTMSWSKKLDGFPLQLSKMFPENNLIITFPEVNKDYRQTNEASSNLNYGYVEPIV